MKIKTIPPTVDERTALRLVRRYRGGLPWQREEVVGVELVFVPYHLFNFRVRSAAAPGAVQASGLLAVDAVRGVPVLVQGAKIEVRNAEVNAEVVYEGRLDREAAAETARRDAPALLARAARSFDYLDLDFVDSLHLPYWIGVYRRKGRTYFGVVIDGNRPEIAPGLLEIIGEAEKIGSANRRL